MTGPKRGRETNIVEDSTYDGDENPFGAFCAYCGGEMAQREKPIAMAQSSIHMVTEHATEISTKS